MSLNYSEDETLGETSNPLDHAKFVALEAEQMPWKPKAPFPVSRYSEAIENLRQRGYSFAEIAQWLNEKLAPKLKGTTITRAQVYHAFQISLEREYAAVNEAIANGSVVSVPHISDEEAEAKAAAEDGDSSPKGGASKRTKRAKK